MTNQSALVQAAGNAADETNESLDPSDAAAWYSASQTAELLEPHFGGSARQLIFDRLKDGRVRAHAQRVWDSDAASLSEAWRARHEAGAETDVFVERSVWRKGRHAAFDLAQARWAEGRFVVTRRKRPADRTILEGVRFLAADIDRLVPDTKILAPKLHAGGREPKYDAWGQLCCILITMHSEGLLKKTDKMTSITKLANQLEEQLDGKLSSETIRRALSPVWKRFVEEEEDDGQVLKQIPRY